MTSDPDYRLTDLIRVYDGALDAALCEQIIALFRSDPDGQFERERQSTWIEYLITRNPNPAWRDIERRLVDNMIEHLKDYSSHPAARMLGLRAPRAFEHLFRLAETPAFAKHFGRYLERERSELSGG